MNAMKWSCFAQNAAVETKADFVRLIMESISNIVPPNQEPPDSVRAGLSVCLLQCLDLGGTVHQSTFNSLEHLCHEQENDGTLEGEDASTMKAFNESTEEASRSGEIYHDNSPSPQWPHHMQ